VSWRPDAAGFLADLEAIPEDLRALATRLADDPWPVAARPDRVVFLGLGSSRYAALVGAARLRAAGIDAVAESAGAEVAHPGGPGTLAVGISASGTTPEVVAALARHAAGGSATIALTAAAGDAALDRAAADRLGLAAPPEAGGIACLTFRHTLLRSLQLVAQLSDGDLAAVAGAARTAADAAEDLLARRPAWLPAIADHLAGGPAFLIWPADRFGAAAQAALTLREGPRHEATACESADWPHVDVYLTKPLGPAYRAIVSAGAPADAEIARWIRERDARLAVVGPGLDPVGAPSVRYAGDGDVTTRLLVDGLVPELGAATLWARV